MAWPRILSRPALASSALALALVALAPACGDGGAPPDFAALHTDVERPGAAAQGEVVAYLVARDGELVIRDRGGGELPPTPGLPLLADDSLTPAKGALALVLLRNGYTVRVDGGVTLRIDDLAVFTSPPARQSIEDQLRASLSSDERARLGDAGERIGGWQLRRTALDGLAPEEMPAAAPAPIVEPTASAAPKRAAADVAVEAEAKAGGASGAPPGGHGRAADAPLDGLPAPEPETAELQEESRDEPAATKDDGGGGATKAPATNPGKKAKASSRGNSAPAKDEAAASTRETAGQGGAPPGDAGATPAWRAKQSAWTDGDGGPPGAAVLQALAQCMADRAGASAIVRLTVEGGRIKEVEIDGAASPGCAAALKGVLLKGAAGTLRIEMVR